MALTQGNKSVTKYVGLPLILPIAATQTIYYQAMFVVEGGYAKRCTGVAQGHLKVVGIAKAGLLPGQNAVKYDDADNSAGAAGALLVEGITGVFDLKNDPDALGALAAADAGLPCYAIDDETVSKDSAEGNRPYVGIFLGLNAKSGRAIVAIGLEEAGNLRIWTCKANADLRTLQYTAVKLVNDTDKTEAASCTAGTDVAVFGILLNAPNIHEMARICIWGPCPGKAVAGGYTSAQMLMAGAGGALELAAAARYFIARALETAAGGATEMVFVGRGTTVA
jgi:hypothetical protein